MVNKKIVLKKIMINVYDFKKDFAYLKTQKKKNTHSSEVVECRRVWTAVSNSTPGTSGAARVGDVVAI